MSNPPATPAPGSSSPSGTRVYHVGPWRQLVGWLFVPFAVPMAIGAMFVSDANERAGLLVGALAFMLVTLAIVWMIRFARLQVGPQGVVLRQIGYRLETDWANIVGIRLDRGHEGFVTERPVGGKNADTLAAAASITPYGFYDGSQQSLLDQHRLIPIEAFAYHIRKGLLAREIRHYAPHLASDLAQLNAKPTPEKKRMDRKSFWTVVAIITASLAWGGVMVMLGERFQARFFNTVYALLDPIYVMTSAYATVQMFRRRSWLFTVLMALMTLVAIGWLLVDWGRLVG